MHGWLYPYLLNLGMGGSSGAAPQPVGAYYYRFLAAGGVPF